MSKAGRSQEDRTVAFDVKTIDEKKLVNIPTQSDTKHSTIIRTFRIPRGTVNRVLSPIPSQTDTFSKGIKNPRLCVK